MMDYGHGFGAGGWIAMSAFWVALITLAVWLVLRAFDHDGGRVPDTAPGRDGGPDGAADDILGRRFAAESWTSRPTDRREAR